MWWTDTCINIISQKKMGWGETLGAIIARRASAQTTEKTVHVFYVSVCRYMYTYCSTTYTCSGLIFVPTSSPYDQYSTRLHEHGTVEAFRWPHDCSPPACSGHLLRARRSTMFGRGRLWCNRRGHIFSRHRALRNGLSMIARTYCNP